MRKTLCILAFCSLLGACGGRITHPVAETNPYDNELSCEHLKAELEVNKSRISGLKDEGDNDMAMNAGLLAVGSLFMDASNSEKTEISALQKRNDTLEKLISTKCQG